MRGASCRFLSTGSASPRRSASGASARRCSERRHNVRLRTLWLKRLIAQFGSTCALASWHRRESRGPVEDGRPGMDEDEFIDDIPFPGTELRGGSSERPRTTASTGKRARARRRAHEASSVATKKKLSRRKHGEEKAPVKKSISRRLEVGGRSWKERISSTPLPSPASSLSLQPQPPTSSPYGYLPPHTTSSARRTPAPGSRQRLQSERISSCLSRTCTVN